MNMFDVAVIGEGVSGLTAANLLAARELKVATFEAQMFGGLVVNVNELKPGLEEREISGAELAAGLMEANAEVGVTSIQEAVTGIRKTAEGFEIATSGGAHAARRVILASGARLRKLGIPGEAEFEGRGVSQCADCDGPIFYDKEVVVVGGGDSALQEALVLAGFCRKVHLVCRGTRYRARAEFADAVAANPKIATLWNARVESITGDKVVKGVRVTHADGKSQQVPCDAVFAYIGLEASADYVPPEILRDANGFIVTDAGLRTATEGIWAIGAVRSGFSGLLPDAAAEARAAAEAAAAERVQV